jgi:hypothetical protein
MKTLLVYLFTLSFLFAGAQSLDTVQAKSQKPSDSIDSMGVAVQGETPAIYNGRVFYGYPLITGHAFFSTNSWQKGSVLYDGIWYHDINMMYDINQQVLNIQHPTLIPIQLFSERVKQFNIGDQVFVRLMADKDNGIKKGFYQQLVEGNVTIYASRIKRIEETMTNMTLEKKFAQVNSYYVFKDGKYQLIKNQNSLLDLLRDSRQAIIRHLKQQDLRFRDNKEKAIVQIAEFYNQSHK